MTIKNTVLFTLLAAVIGFAVGERYAKPKVETKVVTVEKEVVKTDVVTRIIESKKPDGTIEKETILVEKTEKRTDKQVDSSATSRNQKDNYVRASYAVVGDIAYEIGYGKRIVGPAFIDIAASTNAKLNDGQLKLGITVEF